MKCNRIDTVIIQRALIAFVVTKMEGKVYSNITIQYRTDMEKGGKRESKFQYSDINSSHYK